MSEREAIQALADLTDVVPIPIEFKQPRGLASGINKNMPLGIRRDADSFAKVQVRRQLQEVRRRLEGYFGDVLNLGSGVDLGRRERLGEMGPGKRQNRDDATETWTSPHCCLLARSRTATDGRSERSRRNLRFGVQVDASIPQSGLLGGARIVQCEMILKSISFPMQDDPEIGILPRCEVDADSDEEYGSADAGSD